MSLKGTIDTIIQNGTDFSKTISEAVTAASILNPDQRANSILTVLIFPLQARSSYTDYDVHLECNTNSLIGSNWVVVKTFNGADHDDNGGFFYSFASSLRVSYRFRLEDAATDTTLRQFHVLLTG